MQDDCILFSKLWDLANFITGFAIAQGLTFAYASVQKELAVAIDSFGVRVLISILIVLFSSGYCYGVVWCHKQMYDNQQVSSAANTSISTASSSVATDHASTPSGQSLLNTRDEHISRLITRGRIVCIVAFAFLSLLAALGPLFSHSN